MLSPLAKRQMLNALDQIPLFMSLNESYSALTGNVEVIGPAYARQPVSFLPAVTDPAYEGVPWIYGTFKELIGTVAFSLPAGAVIRYVGLHDALVEGTALAMSPIGGPFLLSDQTNPFDTDLLANLSTINRPGLFVLDPSQLASGIFYSPTHGLGPGDRLVFWSYSSASNTLPALDVGPIEEGFMELVVTEPDVDSFRLRGPNGEGLSWTVPGYGYWQRVTPAVITSDDGYFAIRGFWLWFGLS